MDTTYILLGAVIAGITELLNRLRAKDYWVVITITTAAVTGAIFGFFGIEGLTVVTGVAAGFGVSGTLTGIGMIGKKSEPAPSGILEK